MKWEPNIDKFISNADINTLLKATEAYYLTDLKYGRKTWIIRHALIELMVGSGLRIAEARDLKVKDILLSKSEPCLIVRKGKGGRKRTVYISKRLAKLLLGYLKEKELIGQSVSSEASLFANTKDKPFRRRSLQRSIKEALKVAGLGSSLSAHCLRHSYASEVAKKGNLMMCRSQLGHASIVTSQVYLHVTGEEISHTVDGLFS